DVRDRLDDAEQEAFRREVVAWLAAHLDGVGSPPDGNNTSVEEFERNHAFWRELAKQGWYAPGWPVEYGGAGLPRDKAMIVQEELITHVPAFHTVRRPGDIGSAWAGPGWASGPAERRRRSRLP